MFLGEDSEYEVPSSTIKCGIIKSVRSRPQWSWQEYMILMYCGTGIPSIAMRSWRKWFWRICIKYTKQNVTLHNAAGFLPYQHDTEKIWNCCCHPQISAWCPFLPLKFIFNSTWLCTELLDSVLCPRVRRRWWWDATWVPFPWISL